MSKDRYKSNIAFIDLLFNILLGISFMFIVAFFMINPITKKGDIEKNVEFIITMEWPKGNLDDVDLWVKGPTGEYVGFKNREGKFLHYERDDRGVLNDTVVIDGRRVTVEHNKETVTIRGIIPGWYLISVHMFTKNDYDESKVPVIVRVLKLNPYKQIYKQTEILEERRDVKNFRSFRVDSKGNVVNIIDTDESAVPIS